MKIIQASEITRPTMHIVKLERPDGTWAPGASYWSAVEFVTDLETYNVVGKYDEPLRIQHGPLESWEFHGATVMVHPDASDELNKYILTFSRSHRIP